MPALRFDRLADDVRSVVWASTESEAALAAALPEAWRARLPRHPARRCETLGARRALLALAPELADGTLDKDAYGKPYLRGGPPLHFSLSHSHGHAAALVSGVACGVDLQRRVPKITRLRSKFERPDERASVERQPSEVDALHVLWGAKEALYKLYGRRGLDWHEDMVVAPFDLTPGGGAFRGEIRKGGEVIHARLAWRWQGEWCLVGGWADGGGGGDR